MDLHGAYAVLKLWYRHMSIRAPRPSWDYMAKFTKDYGTLYFQEDPDPPGQMLVTQVDFFQIKYEVPSEAEVEAEVRRLRPHKAGVHTHLHADHFKTWLRETYLLEGSKNLSKPGRWMHLVEIVHYIWITG